MPKLAVQEFLTLDGVMQAPGPNDDDREGGFAHGGWLAPYFDDPLWHTIGQLHAQAGGLLLGTGKRLFAEGTVPIGLRLVETSTSAMGVVLATYEPASRLDTRS